MGRQGLKELTQDEDDTGRYRVPTLRHLKFTAPYYHDGTGATLSDVLKHYNAGGRDVMSGQNAGDGRQNPFKDPRIRPLALNQDELNALEMFLLSLSNDEVLIRADWSDPWVRRDAAENSEQQ